MPQLRSIGIHSCSRCNRKAASEPADALPRGWGRHYVKGQDVDLCDGCLAEPLELGAVEAALYSEAKVERDAAEKDDAEVTAKLVELLAVKVAEPAPVFRRALPPPRVREVV